MPIIWHLLRNSSSLSRNCQGKCDDLYFFDKET